MSERLQTVTETLAAARTPEEVYAVVLTPALEALGAIAGAVLLVDETGQRLETVATQAHEEGAQILWQDGPLDGNVPAGDALTHHKALFFEQEGDLVRAYPELETRTGGVAAVATAVLPMFLDHAPLGVIILDFREPHHFTPEEERFLRTLAAQCALALGRARLTADLQRQVQERTARIEEGARAQEAFVAFTQAVGTETDLLALARQATLVLRARFHDGTIAYYTREGDLWKAQVWSEDMGTALVERVTAGLPGSTPLIRRALDTGTAVFTDAWDPEREGIAPSEEYGSAAAYPLTVDGEVRHLLLIGLRDTRRWSEPDRALVRAVGRGLNLALERAEQARQLQARQDEEVRRSQALSAFAELSRDLVLETDPLVLIRRSQEIVLALLPPGFSGYYELREGLWRTELQVGRPPTPELQAALNAGLPFKATPNPLSPRQSGEPHDQDEYNPGADHLTGSDAYPGATATIPVVVGGQTRGILGFALSTVRRWSGEDRAVLETVGRQLTLALERAEQTRRLAVQNAELDARTRALEGFASLTQDLATQDDPRAFVHRAQEVVMTLLPPGYALYYERDGDRWRNRVQVGDTGNADLQAFIDAGPPVGVTPSVDVPWTTGEPLYQDSYARGSDTPEDMVQHVSAAASLPVFRHGEVVGVFIAVLFETRVWSLTDRVVLETVVRSLGAALERVEAARDLKTVQRRLRAVVDNAPVVLFALDRQGTFTLSEGRGLAGLGLQPGEAEGQSAFDLYRGVPELLDDLRLALTGQEVHQTRRIAARVFESWTIPVKDTGGTVTDLVGVSVDVTERQQAEEHLARSNEELRRSNAELEQFAYVASHDLQAPIRAVTSFAGMIDRRYGPQLDERGRLYLRQIVEGGEHMKRLVDDLLAFSRVHTQRGDLLPVDAGAVFDVVARRLQTGASSGTSVTRDALPVVLADAQQLDGLFQNLIANGLKYHREGVAPQVHVRAERDGTWWRFAVSDNGIGIEAQYFDRIFVIFQRLHGREKYEGTGIGLAVCKKIVERHGGRLWLESTPGLGSTFFFTLPAG